MKEENYKPTDTIWVGACNDYGYYEPMDCEYQDLYQGEDRLPIFDSEKECQEWCLRQPREEQDYSGVENLMSDFNALYDTDKEEFVRRIKEKYPELI